jgi:hypothetical protein
MGLTFTTTLSGNSAGAEETRWWAWQAVRNQIASSRQWALLLWWYFALLLISVVSKYVGSGWGDLGKTAHSGQPGWLHKAEHVVEVLPRVFRVYRADVLETWFIIALLVVVGHVVARIRLSILAWVSVSIATLVAFVSWLAQHQTGVPLTYSTLMISVQWSAQHPEVIATVLPLPAIALVVLITLIYGGLPTVFASSWARRGWRAPLAANTSLVLAVCASVLVVLALTTPGPRLPSMTKTMSPAEGFWSSTIVSLADADRESPVNMGRPSRASVLEAYRTIAYPLGRGAHQNPIAALPGPGIPRHVVLIVLETAPQEFYRLGSDSSYTTFREMSQHSIVTDHHFTTRPYTLFAIYSILTGTYPRPGAPIGEYGGFRNDGLANTLAPRGYETTYIDSYRVDWGYHYRAELQRQGFQTILDTAGFKKPPTDDPFEVGVARERWSLKLALNSVASAASHRKKALVVVATTLGHFPWRSPASMKSASSSAKLHSIAAQMDSAVGVFLHGLDSLRLRDSVIVVVTGDHGLRYAAEFSSFGYSGHEGNLDFNVPFLLYAPGIIRNRIDLPYSTSHIDIAPTIYSLLGIPTDSLLLHGENMLDRRLADRATFLMNTGIYPVDGFEFKAHRFSANTITNDVQITPPLSTAESAAYPSSDKSIRNVLNSANHVFNLTAAEFLTRDGARVERKRNEPKH